MSAISSKERPDKNDIVLGVVTKITNHGVYAKLIEYSNTEAYCHISEVAGAWIRNIRNFVRIDQQIVAKVLRSTKSNQIDISIKRVSAQQKKEKTLEYKNQMAALAIISLIAQKLNKSESEVRQAIEPVFLEEFGSLYHGFEFIASEGEDGFNEILNLDDEFKQILLDMVNASIKLSTYEKEVTLGIRSFSADGVEQVREVLIAISSSLEKYDNVTHELFSIGAPKYRLWLSGQFHEDLDDAVEEAKRALEKYAEDAEGLEYSIQEKK